MNHIVDAVAVVDQAKVAANDHVTAVARGRGQSVLEIFRNWVAPPAQIWFEHVAVAKAAFIFGSKAVAIPEPLRRPLTVVLVPFVRFVAIIIVETVVAMVFILVMMPVVVIIPIPSVFPRHGCSAC